MTILGWITLISLFLLIYFGVEWALVRLLAPAPGADVVVFAVAKSLGKEMVIGALFALMLLVAAIAWVKHLAAALLLAGGVCVGLAYWNWYAPYTAITFHRDRLELHYLWPRSSEFTLPKDIVSMNILLSGQVRGEGGSDTFYALEIKTSGGRHESMAIGSQEPVLAVKERIMRMGK